MRRRHPSSLNRWSRTRRIKSGFLDSRLSENIGLTAKAYCLGRLTRWLRWLEKLQLVQWRRTSHHWKTSSSLNKNSDQCRYCSRLRITLELSAHPKVLRDMIAHLLLGLFKLRKRKWKIFKTVNLLRRSLVPHHGPSDKKSCLRRLLGQKSEWYRNSRMSSIS